MGKKITAKAIGNPQFINIQPYNPLISECEIKVFYIGQNRNKSYISKEVATEMANSLPGNPIVGYYRKDKQDFADHGERITIDSDGFKVECLTQPYGFVAPNAKVWFQEFEEEDEFGNTVTREYLMTTGFLWTGQFKEAQQILDDGGKPHSMELDEKTLEGHWAEDFNQNMEFFIITDGIFSKLCVLGDEVEPCFEGSCITSPEVSSTFSLDKDFQQTLLDMMKELKYTLEGGSKMDKEVTQDVVVEEEATVVEDNVESVVEDNVENNIEEEASVESDFSKDNKEEEKEDTEEEEEDDDKKKYSLLEEKYTKLENEYSQLQSSLEELKKENESLSEFKLKVEKEEKEDLIESFFMLDDSDKKDVKENIDKYTKDEIESKLSVICVRKKVKFDLEDTNENENNIEDVSTTYTINSEESSIPDWIRAVKENEE